MINRENGTNDPDWKNYFCTRAGFGSLKDVKSGLLCSEVGMGKSLVCIALVLANPSDTKMMTDAQIDRVQALSKRIGIIGEGGVLLPSLSGYLPASMVPKTTRISERNWKKKQER